jgi:hypothetical protein
VQVQEGKRKKKISTKKTLSFVQALSEAVKDSAGSYPQEIPRGTPPVDYQKGGQFFTLNLGLSLPWMRSVSQTLTC